MIMMIAMIKMILMMTQTVPQKAINKAITLTMMNVNYEKNKQITE